jgi:Transglycosylase SLT domain/SPOR domain
LQHCLQKYLALASGMILLFAILRPQGVFAQDAGSNPTEPVFQEGQSEFYTRAGAEASKENQTQEALCLMVESAARAEDLPLDFFARVIWQESHFQINAVGPRTRSGQRAQGIAQFMPATARERALLDPFNPVQALPKAAEFLAELRKQFGNLGLAAAAYNAGPRRVQEWLAGSGGMPAETINYVLAVTGRGLDQWASVGRNDEWLHSGAKPDCRELVAMLKIEPSHFLSQLERSVAQTIAKPWGLQIASGFNRDRALAAYAEAMKNISAGIGQTNLQPILVRSRGTSAFYQVRIGTSTRREADSLCERIRRARGACLVKKGDA